MLLRIALSDRLGIWRSTKGAHQLIKAQRYEEADALLHAAHDKWSDSPEIVAAMARAAQSRGRYAEAAQLWQKGRELGVSEPFASARLAASLRLLGDHPAAQALVDSALVAYPKDVRVLTEAARLAQDGNRPYDAAKLWQRAICRAKPHVDWLQGYALSLLRTNELDRAHRVIASTRRDYPHRLDLMALHGWISIARQDWARAIAIWTEHSRLSPNEAANKEALGIAVHSAELSGNAAAATSEIASLYPESTRRLVLNFESLGENCELGIVQRRFGAEPLGLLRWNDVGLENLIAALDEGFRGMGEPGNTAMTIAADGELFLRDRRWDLAMQTSMFEKQVDANDVYKKMCRRIVYLRDKLIDDLAEGRKIFVYRSAAVHADRLRRLHRALRAHGPAILLSVQPGSPVGDVTRLDDGLYVGFLPHLGSMDPSNYNVDFGTWITLFTKALNQARVQSRREIGIDDNQAIA